MSNIQQISREVIMNQLQSLTSTELLQLVTSQISRIEQDHNERFTLQEVVNSNTEKAINELKAKINYSNNDGYYTIQRLGLQFNPPMKNKMANILIALGVAKRLKNYNGISSTVPTEFAEKNNLVRTTFTPANDKGHTYPIYHYSLEGVKALMKEKLNEKQMNEFLSHLDKKSRDKWTENNFKISKTA